MKCICAIVFSFFASFAFCNDVHDACTEGSSRCASYQANCLEQFSKKYDIQGTLDTSSDFGLVFLVRKKGHQEEGDYVVKMIPIVSKELIQFYSHADSHTKHELAKYKIKNKFIEYSSFKDIHGNPQEISDDEIFISQKLSELASHHESLNYPILEDLFVCDFVLQKHGGKGTLSSVPLQHPISGFPDMHWYYSVVKKHSLWVNVLEDPDQIKKFRESEELLLFSLRFSLYKAWEKYGFVHGDILNGTGNNILYTLESVKQKYIVFQFESTYFKFEIKQHQIPLLLLFDFSFSDMLTFKRFKKVPMTSLSAYPIGDRKSTDYKRVSDIKGINYVLSSILGAHKDYIPQVSTEHNRDLISTFPSKALTASEYEAWKKTVSSSDILFIH